MMLITTVIVITISTSLVIVISIRFIISVSITTIVTIMICCMLASKVLLTLLDAHRSNELPPTKSVQVHFVPLQVNSHCVSVADAIVDYNN